MASLVLELQQSAMSVDQHVKDLLRKAFVVATKLGLEDFQAWCTAEMNGYTSEVPSYRMVKGELKAWNPYNGWIPVIMGDVKSQEILSKRAIGQPIGELEDISLNARSGALQIPLPPRIIETNFSDSEFYRLGMVPTLLVGKNSVVGILEAVRNKILTWSLDLEKNGILGEDLTFSKKEVQAASNVTYNIENFSGVLGNISNGQIQIGDYNSIHAELKKLGISQTERNILEEILDQLPKATDNQRDGLLQKGRDWLMRNASSLGTLSETIRKWFETV
ncbi:MAG: hypothetical protein AB7P17_15280 [Nitrospirales bacterium]|nr:hypothetical protein [Nitrospirales bacterium]